MTPANDPINVLVCDDSPAMRRGLRDYLNTQEDLQPVGEAQNGLEAVALTRDLQPDVVLMDLKMPELDGVAATSQIKDERPRTNVVIFTQYNDDPNISRAFDEGATSYVLKDAPPEEFFTAIRRAAAGASQLSPPVQTRLVRMFYEQRNSGLTPHECEVLRLIARGGTNRTIAQDLYVAEQTVKDYVTRINEKLGSRGRTNAVVRALQRGIIHLDEC